MSRILIVLARSKGLLGKLIRWFTKSEVNHAYIIFYSAEWNDFMAIEIDERGIVIVPAFKEEHKYCYSEEYELKNADKDKIITALVAERGLIGAKYDWLGLISFGFRMLVWRLTGTKDFMHPVHSKTRLFCSEYVANVINDIVDEKPFSDPANVSPADLREWLINSDLFHKVEK